MRRRCVNAYQISKAVLIHSSPLLSGRSSIHCVDVILLRRWQVSGECYMFACLFKLALLTQNLDVRRHRGKIEGYAFGKEALRMA